MVLGLDKKKRRSMPTCLVCGLNRKDLTKHVLVVHGLSGSEYKTKYNGILIDLSVAEKRKDTCLLVHGDANYRNEPARRLSYELYEGGHPLCDPAIRAKAADTMRERYGVEAFNNRDKAKLTCLAKYGVENPGQNSEVNEKRNKTLIARYGRVFNHVKQKLKPPEGFAEVARAGESISILAVRYGVTLPVVSRWLKELGIVRSVVALERRVQTPTEIVQSYFDTCVEKNTVLSFHEYGRIRTEADKLKMKRLFGGGKRFNSLVDKLKTVALNVELWPSFLSSLV